MMSRPVDNFLEKMACDHIRVMDLEVRMLVNKLKKLLKQEGTYKDTPEVHQHK